MVYRYYYNNNTGDIFGYSRYPGTLEKPGKTPQGMGTFYVDVEQPVNADQHRVDLTTMTLVPRNQ